MILYNNQWYYGNQHNQPTLVSTSKEMNVITKYQNCNTITTTLANGASYPITFSGWDDYYTYDYFVCYLNSPQRYFNSNGDLYVDMDIGGSNGFTIMNSKIKYNNTVILIPTYCDTRISHIAFGAGTLADFNTNSTNNVNYLSMIQSSSSTGTTQWSILNYYSMTNVTVDGFYFALNATKFEY